MFESISKISFVGGIVSVFISLGIWFMAGEDELSKNSGERLAIFVGLWAPTMFALSTCLRHMGRDRG